MALPNLSGVIKSFSQEVELHKIVVSIENHRKVEQELVVSIDAMIQPQETSKLNKDVVDYSLDYILVHSVTEIEFDDYITYNNKQYKCFEIGKWNDYGFFIVVMEEIK